MTKPLFTDRITIPNLKQFTVRGITINTDASVHGTKQVGGYAFHIVCDLFKLQQAGVFKSPVKHSTDAEMKSIGNAIAALLRQPELPTCKWVVINTDSKGAISAILQPKNDLSKCINKDLHKLKVRLRCQLISFRHVRAHTKDKNARSLANEWCDIEAKKMMRIAAGQ